MPSRCNVDDTVNDHGKSLLQFCIQANKCVCNGRITPLLDNFTTISHRRKSGVHYVLVPHSHLSTIDILSVRTCSELTELYRLPVAKGRISDHSVLTISINTALADTERNEVDGGEPVTTDTPSPRENTHKLPKRYRKTKLPENFMTSDERLTEYANLIDMLLELRINQSRID